MPGKPSCLRAEAEVTVRARTDRDASVLAVINFYQPAPVPFPTRQAFSFTIAQFVETSRSSDIGSGIQATGC